MKGTSGLALNILIKLIAILSLVFLSASAFNWCRKCTLLAAWSIQRYSGVFSGFLQIVSSQKLQGQVWFGARLRQPTVDSAAPRGDNGADHRRHRGFRDFVAKATFVSTHSSIVAQWADTIATQGSFFRACADHKHRNARSHTTPTTCAAAKARLETERFGRTLSCHCGRTGQESGFPSEM